MGRRAHEIEKGALRWGKQGPNAPHREKMASLQAVAQLTACVVEFTKSSGSSSVNAETRIHQTKLLPLVEIFRTGIASGNSGPS